MPPFIILYVSLQSMWKTKVHIIINHDGSATDRADPTIVQMVRICGAEPSSPYEDYLY